MGKPVNSMIKLTAYLIDRVNGKIVASKSFRNRVPGLLIAKLAAWLFVLQDDYPNTKYKLLIRLEGENDKRMLYLKEKFRKLGITIAEEPLRVMV